MILVDTSVWIDHLRTGDDELVQQLNNNSVLMHPFVLGELACGNLNKRREVLTLFKDLPGSPVATDNEVLFFIEQHKLMGRGIGYIDTHLLAAVALKSSARLWTRDKRLRAVGDSLSLTCEMD
jgi:predicted nucleic acid-binding protein